MHQLDRQRVMRWLSRITIASVLSTLAVVGYSSTTPSAAAAELSDGISVAVSPEVVYRNDSTAEFTLRVTDANPSGAAFREYLLAGIPNGWVIKNGATALAPVSPDPLLFSLPRAAAQAGTITIVPPAGYEGTLAGVSISRANESENFIKDFDGGTFDYIGTARPQLPVTNTPYTYDNPTRFDPVVNGVPCGSNQYGPFDGCYTIWTTGNMNGPAAHLDNKWADVRSVDHAMQVDTRTVCGPMNGSTNTYQVPDDVAASSGKLLVINGSSTMPRPNNLITTTVTGLQPNTYYSFSGYIANLSYDPATAVNPVQSAFVAGDTLIGSSVLAPHQSGCYNDQTEWTQVKSLVNTGDATSLTISVRNYAAGGFGNDLGIDNLALHAMAHSTFDLRVEPAAPQLTIVKDDGVTVLNPGQETTYTVTTSNAADAGAASGVVIEDQLPSQLTYVSSSNGGSFDSSTRKVTWSLGDIAPGAQTSVTMTARVTDDTPSDTEIRNAATIVAPAISCITSCVAVDIDKTPARVSIAKDDGKAVVPAGEQTTYDIVISNLSTDQAATGVVVTDVLPSQLDFVSATAGGTYDPATRTVTWSIGALQAGARSTVRITAVVNASTPPDTDITNTAGFTTDNGCDSGCTATDTDLTPPAVSIGKDDHKTTVKPGEELSYDVTISNLSSKQSADGIVITDSLPAGLNFKAATNGGSYDADTRTVTWNIGTLAAGGATTVQVKAIVDEATPMDTSVVNVASVTTDNGCLNPAGCEATDTDKTPASVSIVKDDHTIDVKPGENTTYDLVVSNASKDQAATGVVATDALPAELIFVAATDGGIYDPTAHTVTWNLGDLEPEAAKTVHLTTTVDPATGPDAVITNIATIDTEQGCHIEADCNAADTDRTPPSVTIVKDDHKTTVKPGESTTYELVVANTSMDQTAESVVVTDALPAQLEFAAASDGGVYDPSTREVTWEIGDLAAGGERTVRLTAVVDAATATDTDVVNTATVETSDGCLVKADCETSDTDTTPPAVSIAKDDHEFVVGLGKELTYDLVVTNASSRQNATGVVVTDDLPQYLSFVSATDAGVHDAAAATVSWRLGDLAPGESRIVQVTTTVSDETPSGAEIANAATVRTDQGCVVESDCESIDIDRTPDISIVKDDHTTVVIPGQSITYDLTVTNHGDYAATGVTVTDVLPELLSFASASDGGVFDRSTGTVTWKLGELEGEAVKVVRITGIVSEHVSGAEDLINTAIVSSDAGCIGDGCSSTDKDHIDPPAPFLAVTGSTVSIMGIWLAACGILLGGTLLILRRRRSQNG